MVFFWGLSFKGYLRFCYGEGERREFWWTKNAIFLERRVGWWPKLYRRTLWTHPALFELCLVFFYGKIKISQRLIKVPEKTSKLSPGLAGAAYGCQTSKLLKSFQLRSIALRNRFIAFLCTSNWFFGPKREKTGLVHFPSGFRGKIFEIFFGPKWYQKII